MLIITVNELAYITLFHLRRSPNSSPKIIALITKLVLLNPRVKRARNCLVIITNIALYIFISKPLVNIPVCFLPNLMGTRNYVRLTCTQITFL
jgi:hypothetical protein